MKTHVSPSETPAERCDVLVIGGSPAGSTMAAPLAAEGRDVVLLEKARHPRFHIGESLLPSNVELFARPGVREQVEQIDMPKFGIEFGSPDHEHRSYLDLAEAWDKSRPFAWQVRRSQLDELLFCNYMISIGSLRRSFAAGGNAARISATWGRWSARPC